MNHTPPIFRPPWWRCFLSCVTRQLVVPIALLLEVTQARPHPDMADDAAEQWGAEVVVTLKDGRRVSRRVHDLVGRGGDRPMSDAELWDKFEDCAIRALPRDRVAPLYERLETLDKAAEMREVTRLLQTGPLLRPQSRTVVFAPRGEHEPEETTWVP